MQKKDLNTGKLYGIMIYRMTGSYEDQAIILADSGMLQSTAEKKHLVMSLWSGEWFENMKSQELAGSAAVPYRRETFVSKKIVLDFDGDFSAADASSVSNDARTKSLAQIRHDLDSIRSDYDSIGRAFYQDIMTYSLRLPHASKRDSLKAVERAASDKYNVDTLMAHMTISDRQRMLLSLIHI